MNARLTSRIANVLLLCGALACVAVLSTCGGGGRGGSSPPPPPPQFSFGFSTFPDAIGDTPYNQTLTAVNGTPPYTWSVTPTSNPMPPGLTLTGAGVLSGTPIDPGVVPITYSFTIQVQDSAARSLTRTFSIRLVGRLRFTSTTIVGGNPGQLSAGPFYVSGGVPPLFFSLVPGSGSLPPGISLVGGGVEGFPTTPGSYTFSISVRDSGTVQQTATQTFTMVITNHPWITSRNLPTGVVGQPLNFTMQAIAGTPPYTWSAPNGGVPAGLTLQPDGVIIGTPTQAASGGFLVQVTDSGSPPDSNQAFVSYYMRPELSIPSTGLPDGIQGQLYDTHIFTSGGTPPISLRVSAGTVPTGMGLFTLDAVQGLFHITGTPQLLETRQFTIEAKDSSVTPVVVTRDLSIRVNSRLKVDTSSLPPGMEGTPYQATAQASGGVQPYRWYVGGLPSGVTIDQSTGQISGTPTAAYSQTTSLQVRDASFPEQFASVYFPLKIVGLLRINTSVIPRIAVDQPVSMKLDFSGGTPPYQWSMVSGNLPVGMTFNPASAELQGTPSASETQTITLRLADSDTDFPQSIQQTLTIAVLSSLGRNNSTATATPISNGTYRASLSPMDDGAGGFDADNDYYLLTANPGATVTIEINAERLSPSSPMDSLIEIVDVNGVRLQSCNYSPCMNDDMDSTTLDSKLTMQVPGTTGGPPVTFYVRVLDWRGMARPDFVYTITISGAN